MQTFIEIVRAAFEIWTKTTKMHQKWGFSPNCDPQDFFQKSGSDTFLYPYGALTSCKKLEKNNDRSLRYLKTDHRLTD